MEKSMPNWVTNKIHTSPEVVKATVNPEGLVDFSLIAPFPGEFPWDAISCDAEELAQIVTGQPLSTNPMLASLQCESRSKANIANLVDESFEQFIQMLRNHRKCGHLHNMDFARNVWGTKWNACESRVDVDAGTAEFETAWSCPERLLLALSARFPEETIEVTFADEDLGSNCGTFTLKGGAVIASNIAPRWHSMDKASQERWLAFAREVLGVTETEED
jgi:hypothetical protein